MMMTASNIFFKLVQCLLHLVLQAQRQLWVAVREASGGSNGQSELLINLLG